MPAISIFLDTIELSKLFPIEDFIYQRPLSLLKLGLTPSKNRDGHIKLFYHVICDFMTCVGEGICDNQIFIK